VEEYKPTDVELAAIKAELTKVEFPRSVSAALVAAQAFIKTMPVGQWFTFKDRTGEQALMLYQRVEDGEKDYLPWSFWNDGEWRCMEPDGLLPLWGLDQLDQAHVIYIHEGPKAGQYVRWMFEDSYEGCEARERYPWLNDCPWCDDLKDGAHLGWPGGAPNPHRVDWEPIKQLPQQKVVRLVCDNDRQGKNALTKISRILKRSMQAVMFDDRFKVGFDLADEFPKQKDWWKGERYIGPRLEHFISSATWATEQVKAKAEKEKAQRGRPAYKVRDQFAEEWLSVIHPQVHINVNFPHRMLSEKAFNRAVRPFSDVDKTDKLLARVRSSQVDGVAYDPGKGSGLIADQNGDGLLFNTYTPSPIKAMPGDPQPFLDFMEQLLPVDRDCHEMKRWIATLIARPDIKMHYGALLISETQGVGKSTLGEKILAPLVGHRNVSVPDERAICASSFNSWAAQKRLAIVHEIYAGESRVAYDKLKSLITDQRILIDRKFIEGYETDNWIHVFACSNSERALYLDPQDRRWFLPAVTEVKQLTEYWRKLNAWLTEEGGLSIIKWWCEEFLKENAPVATGEAAPASLAKAKVIEGFRTPGVRLAFDFVDYVNHYIEEQCHSAERRWWIEVPVDGDGHGQLRHYWIVNSDGVGEWWQRSMVFILEVIYAWIGNELGLGPKDKRESQNTIRKALREAGLYDVKRTDPKEQRFKIKGKKRYLMSTVPIGPFTSWDEMRLIAEHKEPGDMKPS
jgi:hypothetical protein